MDTTTRAASPLRQRMIEDMRMRKLEPRTQEGYIRAVRKLTVYLKRSPDTASVEDLRTFRRSGVVMRSIADAAPRIPTVAAWRADRADAVKDHLVEHVQALYPTPSRVDDLAIRQAALQTAP
jgi:Phage integrase, N-terminal SAM-like domain